MKAAGSAIGQARQFNAQTGVPVSIGTVKASAPFAGFVAYSKIEYSVWTDTSYYPQRFTGVQGDGSSYQVYGAPFNHNEWYLRGPDNQEQRIR
jgi:hypothetical protein